MASGAVLASFCWPTLLVVASAPPRVFGRGLTTSDPTRNVSYTCFSVGSADAINDHTLRNKLAMIQTFDEAHQFVLTQKVCTVFGSKASPYQSLWDNTGLSENKPQEGGWSPKVIAVWDWKTRIPQTYPDSVFYGKVQGGDAVLMEMQHLRDVHYPIAFQPICELDSLSQTVYELIRLEPSATGPLRKRAMAEVLCTKSQFDTALKKLQVSLNVVRSNDPKQKNDFWLTMREVHLDLVSQPE